jgi:hypothetical protein
MGRNKLSVMNRVSSRRIGSDNVMKAPAKVSSNQVENGKAFCEYHES